MSSGSPLHDLSPGKVVAGRYRVIRAHRQGGLSVAFEVKDEKTGERRELQLFASNLFDEPAQAEEARTILSAWKEVDSDSVLRVSDIALIGPSTIAVVTDFPVGEPLRTRLQQERRFPQEMVIAIGCQLLDGLVEIHGRSLVHGDIKPSTIHVTGHDGDVQVLLVDGGVTPALWRAKDLGEKTALIGTPYYAPVEQFGGESPSVQSDIYNLAAVLFECVTGVLPWPGTSFVDVFQAKLARNPPSMRRRAPEVEVDPELERVIVTGCLADRKERYSSAAQFLRELSALSDL